MRSVERVALTPDGSNQKHAERVAEALRRAIAIGEYPPGSSLPIEGDLMKRYGVSRPTQREAIRILESEGLVQTSRGPKGGAQVLLPGRAPVGRSVGVFLQLHRVTVDELYEARLLIEPFAAHESALRCDHVALVGMAQCLAKQQFSVPDRRAYLEADLEFRKLLLESAGNRMLTLLGATIGDVLERHHMNVLSELPELPQAAAHYRLGVRTKQRLLTQIAAGNADAAQKLWGEYVLGYWKRMKRAGLDGALIVQAYKAD